MYFLNSVRWEIIICSLKVARQTIEAFRVRISKQMTLN